jgi:hypothetical protein
LSSVDIIRKNNKDINGRIANIVKRYREIKREKKEKETVFDEDGILDEDIKSILTFEMKKCVSIYLAEFPKFECKDLDELSIEVENREEKKNQAECRGGPNGIKVYPGIQPFIDGILKKAGIEATIVNGKVCATKVISFKDGDKGVVPEIENGKIKYAEGIKAPNFVSDQMVDSPRDQLDYLAELLIEGKIDIDWMLDVLPHEAMHVFIPGEGVLVEGTTERLTRECADKYGLRLTPTSHQRETQIVAKLEKIIGRDNLAYAMSLNNKDKYIREQSDNGKKEVDEARFERIKKFVDGEMKEGAFEELQSGFEKEYKRYLNKDKKYEKSGKYDFGAYRNEYYSKEESFFKKWIDDYEKEHFDDEEWKKRASFDKTPDESKLDVVLEYQQAENKMLDDLEKKLGIKKTKPIALQEIGEGTAQSFSQNPEKAMKVMDLLEYGVRMQEEAKEGKTQEEG